MTMQFEFIPIHESHEELVDLSNYDFVLEPMYFHQEVSSTNKMCLRKSVADKLADIQKVLINYKFKIWDGYRPREVQNKIYQNLWKKLQEEHPDWSEEKLDSETSIFVSYPSDPNRIPPHSTGGTVDLTLVNSSGKELDMGTEFDYFGPEAASMYFEENNINETIKNNRKLLREAMVAAGFRSYDFEWWHFDYGNQIWAAHYNKPTAIYSEIKS